MLTYLIYVVAMLAFLGSVWLVNKTGCPRGVRYRHLFLPVLAVVYVVGAMVSYGISGTVLWAGVEGLQADYPSLGRVSTSYLVNAAYNALFLVTFAGVKCVYAGLVSLLAPLYDRGLRGLFGKFYTYSEEYGQWHLRVDYAGVRRLLKSLYRACVVLAVLLFVVSEAIFALGSYGNPFYPAVAIIVLGELYFLLDGITKKEYKAQLDFEDDGYQRVFEYARLMDVMDHYFGDRLMSVFSRGRLRRSPDAHLDFCDELRRSENPHERVAGAYFSALVEKGLIGEGSVGGWDELSRDEAMNTVRLLEGKSVMFASPFYRDYAPYVFLPMVANLMRNGKVLVLCGPNSADENLQDYLSSGLAFVTNVERMWTIGSLEDPESAPDIALLPFSSLGKMDTILDHEEFFRQTRFVLVIDPSSLLATYQIGLSSLADKLAKGDPVTYCIFDRNSDGLVDSLSHAFRTNLVEVGATEYSKEMSMGLMWEVDGPFLQHRLIEGISRYLGMGTELGLVGLKHQVSKIAWAAQESVPLVDQRWILGQYHAELFKFAELPQEQAQLDRSFELYPDAWSMRKEENRFVVAEDEASNLFETYRQFATRGSKQSFVNVLSPNYLLREYMVDNEHILAKDPKAIPAFAPDFCKSQRNAVFSIIMEMVQGGAEVSHEDVERRLKHAGIYLDDRSVEEALTGMMIEHIPLGADGYKLEECFTHHERAEYVPEKREVVLRHSYSMNPAARELMSFDSLRNVELITERPDGARVLLGFRLYDHVHQVMLPGQFVTIQGKYYEVLSITRGHVMLRRAADHFSNRRYYRQIRNYALGDWTEGAEAGKRKADHMRKVCGLEVSCGRVEGIRVETPGYLDMLDYGNFETAKLVETDAIPNRYYRNKTALKVSLPKRKVELDEGGFVEVEPSPEVIRTLAVLMGECLRTLYPKDHQFIAVLTAEGNSLAQGGKQGVLHTVKPMEGTELDPLAIYIVEDSMIDIGLVSSIDRNMQRILELCWDYLDWHEGQPEDEAPAPVYEVGPMPELPEPVEDKRWWHFLRRKKKRRAALPQAGGAVQEPSPRVVSGSDSDGSEEYEFTTAGEEPVSEPVVDPADPEFVKPEFTEPEFSESEGQEASKEGGEKDAE